MGEKELITVGQLRSRMKERLPKGTTLKTEAVRVMQENLASVFEKVMGNLAKEPYVDFAGYLVEKECRKFFVQDNTLQAISETLKDLQEKVSKFQKDEALK